MHNQTKHTHQQETVMHSGATARVMTNLDTARAWFSIKTPENGLSRQAFPVGGETLIHHLN